MKKETLYLVTQSKYGNVLGYNLKTSEYVYLKNGKEMWREKSDIALFDYCNEIMNQHSCLNEKILNQYPIWKKYCESIEK